MISNFNLLLNRYKYTYQQEFQSLFYREEDRELNDSKFLNFLIETEFQKLRLNSKRVFVTQQKDAKKLSLYNKISASVHLSFGGEFEQMSSMISPSWGGYSEGSN